MKNKELFRAAFYHCRGENCQFSLLLSISATPVSQNSERHRNFSNEIWQIGGKINLFEFHTFSLILFLGRGFAAGFAASQCQSFLGIVNKSQISWGQRVGLLSNVSNVENCNNPSLIPSAPWQTTAG